VLHIGERCETLLPADPIERARATAWMFAALNSVEPTFQQLASIDLFHVGQAWTTERRPQLIDMVNGKLGRLDARLARDNESREWLEERFTAGDLMMTTVLRVIGHAGLVACFPRVAAYQARTEARPAFGRALAAQLAAFKE
jgi:glutathione S-transferase